MTINLAGWRLKEDDSQRAIVRERHGRLEACCHVHDCGAYLCHLWQVGPVMEGPTRDEAVLRVDDRWRVDFPLGFRTGGSATDGVWAVPTQRFVNRRRKPDPKGDREAGTVPD